MRTEIRCGKTIFPSPAEASLETPSSVEPAIGAPANTLADPPIHPTEEPAQVQPDAALPLTFGNVADRYLEGHVQQDGRRPAGRRLMEWYVAALRRAQLVGPQGNVVCLEDRPIDHISTADVYAIRTAWPKKGSASHGGRIGADRALKRLRHLFNWAVELGLATQTPFKRNGVTVIHFAREHPRVRRLESGEEEKLLKHAPPDLGALIVGTLETGCRRGELQQLRFRDVKWDADILLLPAAITKTGDARDVPLTRRLRALLEVRKHAPDGTEHPPEAFVFGNAAGEPLGDIRDAWAKTCLAAGIEGLQFRDLRREFGSRLRETPGVTDHHVRDWLGHSDLATTSRYLSTTRAGLQQVRRAFERRRRREFFAHDSHTSRSKARRVQPAPTTDSAGRPAKLLN